MVSLVRSIAYTIVFYIGSVPTVLGALLMIPFGLNAVIAASRIWAQYHYFCARWVLGNRLIIDGKLPTGVVIIAIKHECFFETFETLRLFDRPAVVFKAELIDIPVWGRVALAHGVIPVARETGAAALRKMLKAARDAVAADRPIIIFPEGTRIPHGERPPLRPGVAGLYKSLALPIVPIAIDSGRRWGRSSFIKTSGPITMRVGEVIPAGLPREEVEARIHAGINALNV